MIITNKQVCVFVLPAFVHGGVRSFSTGRAEVDESTLHVREAHAFRSTEALTQAHGISLSGLFEQNEKIECPEAKN